MTLRQIAMELIARGHVVKYYIRKDGGIVITKIDNNRYSGKTGNAVARSMLGEVISGRRKSQLERINKEAKKIKKGELKKTTALPEEVEKLWKKLVNEYRKHLDRATITKRQVLQLIEEKGIEGTIDYIKEQIRRTRGYAYHSLIYGLIERFDNDKRNAPPEDQEDLEQCIQIIKEKSEDLTFEQVLHIFEEIYNYESPNNPITSSTLLHRVIGIVK